MKVRFIILLISLWYSATTCAQTGNRSAITPSFRIVHSGSNFRHPPFRNCHAATVTETGRDTLLYAWFGGDYEGSDNTAIWGCFRYLKKKKQWGTVQLLAAGKDSTGHSKACWNPVLYKTSGGILFLYYKTGSNPREWRGERKTSADNGKTWSIAERLPASFLGPVKNKPLQRNDGTLLYPSSTESTDLKTWTIHVESTDATGGHWQYIPIACDSFAVIQPAILQYGMDTLQLLCRSRQNKIIETWSFDNGNTWSALHPLDLPNPNSGIDAVTLHNGWQLLIYNPMMPGKEWWEGRSVLKAAVSKNGKDWQDVITIEQHDTGEYSYPAVIQDSGGIIRIAYTKNRTTINFVDLRIINDDSDTK